MNVNAPSPGIFTAIASGQALHYQWQSSLNGSPWANVASGTGGATASYTTSATALTTNGKKFRVVVSNTGGKTVSASATLTVNVVPSISLQPLAKIVVAPATAKFTAAAIGNPAPSYQWQVSANGVDWNDVTAGSGGDMASYTTAPTIPTDDGQRFRVIATNSQGSKTSNAVLLTVHEAPAITQQPTDQTVDAPLAATFSVNASGPALHYQWQASSNGTTWANVTTGTGGTSASYTTATTTLGTNGKKFRVVVSNTYGSLASTPATLTVNVAPVITLQPLAKVVTAPATATFNTAATGYPAPTYEWQISNNGGKDWTDVTTGSDGHAISYTTAPTITTDNGSMFRVIVTNSKGNKTSNAVLLTVHEAPTITTQPEDITVNEPDEADFAVVATGNLPISFQWQVSTNAGSAWTNVANGAGGMTSNYTTPPTNPLYVGRKYRVVIKNAWGTAISSPASLSVNVIPRTISGNAGMAGATLHYSSGTPKVSLASDHGNYSFEVPYNWSGTVTASLSGCTFSPASYSYANVTTSQSGHNYKPSFPIFALCTSNGQQQRPTSIGDGNGGAFIAWKDGRAGNNLSSIYAQHVNANGTAQWDSNGIFIGSNTVLSDVCSPQMISDGQGGAIIAWEGSGIDYSHGYAAPYVAIYAQRINASGTSQWMSGGVTVCEVFEDNMMSYNFVVTDDGNGGAIIAWEDWRNVDYTSPNPSYDIYAQHLDSAGNVKWAANGVAVCTAHSKQFNPAIIADGNGGAVIAWDDMRSYMGDVYAQRIDSTGAVQWTLDGVAICTPNGSNTAPALASDGNGGAIIAWEDHRNSDIDIYAQRIDSTGGVKWTANGIPVCTATDWQNNPVMVNDASGGAIIAWCDDRSGTGKLYAQRLSASGAIQWSSDGVLMGSIDDRAYRVSISSDSAGSAILGWEKGGVYSASICTVHAQRVDESGAPQWIDGGLNLCKSSGTRGSFSGNVTLSNNGKHRATVAWVDWRNDNGTYVGDNTDIFMSQISIP